MYPSIFVDYPTEENPHGRYKFISIHILLHSEIRLISRKTYSLLDWLGDWGGLLDALFMLAELFVAPFSAVAYRTKLLTYLGTKTKTTHKQVPAKSVTGR